MQSKRTELPVVFEAPQAKIRSADWGGISVEAGDIYEELDPGAFFTGLPDDRCQCPHWGYVIKGALRYCYADHDEVYSAGEVYYAAAGHRPVLEAGTEYVEFSPTDELAKTMAVIERNMTAMMASQT